MNRENLWDTNTFLPAPLRKPRADVLGEVVFIKKWEALMARDSRDINNPPNNQLADVLANLADCPTQREATVAASFVCWLGTNMGRAFLEEAEKFTVSRHMREDVYLYTWAKWNSRKSYVNGGVRALEHILTPDEPLQDPRNRTTSEPRIPSLSAIDYETVEHVALWLGSEKGQAFILDCRRELNFLLNMEMKANHRKMTRKPSISAEVWEELLNS